MVMEALKILSRAQNTDIDNNLHSAFHFLDRLTLQSQTNFCSFIHLHATSNHMVSGWALPPIRVKKISSILHCLVAIIIFLIICSGSIYLYHLMLHLFLCLAFAWI